MSNKKVTIRFGGLKGAEANRAARELETMLEPSIGPGGSIEIAKTSDDTQDMGSTIILVFGTPAVIAIAKGIHDYISKRGNKVIIETANGTVLATGDAAKNIDIAKTAETITKSK